MWTKIEIRRTNGRDSLPQNLIQVNYFFFATSILFSAMKKPGLFILVLLLLLFQNACRQKARQRLPDKKMQMAVDYKAIYESYRKSPADSVEQKLNAFLKKYPDNYAGRSFYAWVLFELGQADSSLAAYKQLIALAPQKAEGYAGVGAIYNTLNQNDSAENYLFHAIALRDSSPYTFLNLSVLYMKKNEPLKSFAFADSCLLKGDSVASICAGLSFVYQKQNEKAKSAQFYDRAVQLGLKDTASFNKVLSGEMKIEDYYRKNFD